jgi:S-DNA-T family DNA segregation ATPase FtsK/SpoIIIE
LAINIASRPSDGVEIDIPEPPVGEQVWRLPSVSRVLEPGSDQDYSRDMIRKQARIIEETLNSLSAPSRVIEVNQGPVVTQFGVEPLFLTNRSGEVTKKVKVSKIASLADDLALALSAQSIRIEAPVPGKGLVGVEVPNEEPAVVALRDVMESTAFAKAKGRLRLGLGQDVSGQAIVSDLRTMPHLLIAGTTGSGKSVCINAIVAALLLQNTPDTLRLMLVDPKRVELTQYNGIPHLLTPTITDMERVVPALRWVMREMDGRYRRFAEIGARHIEDFNRRAAKIEDLTPIPYIAVIVDELADLMMQSPEETERVICRLAQMARATGIHLIIATQRPSVDVVTGLIKANFPARITFAVASSVDSRVVLDVPGAERLLGKGDMLFMPPDVGQPLRLQGAYVSSEELDLLIDYWRKAVEPGKAPESVAIPAPRRGARLADDALVQNTLPSFEDTQAAEQFEDPLLPDAVEILIAENRASISLLQRRLRIGYTRSARLVDLLTDMGIVTPDVRKGQSRGVNRAVGESLLASLHVAEEA